MKKGCKKVISHFLAGTMILSTTFCNVLNITAEELDQAFMAEIESVVTTPAAVAVDNVVVDDDLELEADAYGYWWKASATAVEAGQELSEDTSVYSLKPTLALDKVASDGTGTSSDGITFDVYNSSSTTNGYLDNSRERSGFLLTPNVNGKVTLYCTNINAGKEIAIGEDGVTDKTALTLYYKNETGAKIAVPTPFTANLEAGKTYYLAGTGTKGSYCGVAFLPEGYEAPETPTEATTAAVETSTEATTAAVETSTEATTAAVESSTEATTAAVEASTEATTEATQNPTEATEGFKKVWDFAGKTAADVVPVGAANANGEIYIHDGSGTRDAGKNNGGKGTYVVADDGTVGLKLEPNTGSGKAFGEFGQQFSSGKVTVSADIAFNATNSADCGIFEVRGLGGSGVESELVVARSAGGNFQINNQSSGTKNQEATAVACTPGTTYKVALELDLDNDAASLYVNGEKAITSSTDISTVQYVDAVGFFFKSGFDYTISNVTVVADKAEAPTPVASNITATVDKENPAKGDTIKVDFNLSDITGINNYTFYVDYDPNVIQPVSANTPDKASSVTYKVGSDQYYLIDPAVVDEQIKIVPSADNSDYTGANGVKTAAQLGRIKLAGVVGITQAASAETDTTGTLFSMNFEVVGGGDTSIKFTPIGSMFYKTPVSGAAAEGIDPTIDEIKITATGDPYVPPVTGDTTVNVGSTVITIANDAVTVDKGTVGKAKDGSYIVPVIPNAERDITALTQANFTVGTYNAEAQTLTVEVEGKAYVLALVVYGDVDANGTINVNDARKIANHANSTDGIFNEKQAWAADVDSSEVVNVNDARKVANYVNNGTEFNAYK